MKTLSICGVDGTGKTTLLRRVTAYPALRSPQFHECPRPLACAAESRALEDLGTWADAQGDVRTKACALFLAMTLSGPAERELARAEGSDRLVRERDPIVDSLVYSGFYLKLLRSGWDPSVVPEKFRPALESRCRVIGSEPAALAAFIRDAFTGELPSLPARLYRWFGCFPSSEIVLLKASPETLSVRMAEKARERGSGTREAHEGLQTLLQLQAGLAQVAGLLAQAQGTRVIEIPVDGLTPEETLVRAESALGFSLRR